MGDGVRLLIEAEMPPNNSLQPTPRMRAMEAKFCIRKS